jgi:UDP:flavonoid glycosyltransferase YjiC (YdhE family)
VTLDALAGQPVRVMASTNRRGEALPDAPANAVVVDWMSYSQVMPLADLVITHGGHGTVCRALAAGAPVLCCPAVGDMAENGARVQWAGAGLMLPSRLLGRGSVRTVVRRILGDAGFAERAREIAAWAAANDGAARGAGIVEQLQRTAE